jgi:ATP-dependent metalloprotease
LEAKLKKTKTVRVSSSESGVVAEIAGTRHSFKNQKSVDTQREKIMEDKEALRQVAIHEASHAIVEVALNKKVPESLFIAGVGRIDGALHTQRKSNGRTKKDEMNDIAVFLAGRVGEEMILGKENVGDGAYYDLEAATRTASAMVRQYAMGRNIGVFADNLTELIGLRSDVGRTDLEIEVILRKQKKLAYKVLRKNKIALGLLTDQLLEKRSLGKSDLKTFFITNSFTLINQNE